MNNNSIKGTIFVIVSAAIFGFTPVFASWSYAEGSNAMTLTFYRNAMVVPIMLVVLIIRKVNLRINLREFAHLVITAILFSGTTTFFLYDSYNYIGIGLATTLHFLYPVLTVLFSFLIFKERLDKYRVIAVIVAFIGVAMATGGSDSFGLKGTILAIASSITYAGYLIVLDKSAIRNMDSLKAMFYMCIVISIFFALIDIKAGNIVYALNVKAMFYSFIIAVLNSLFAYVLLIIGIKCIGAGNAAIFSTLEPVFGVICGIFILGESFPKIKILSCIVIMIAILIPIVCDYKKSRLDLNR